MRKSNTKSEAGVDRPKNWPVVRGCTEVSEGCDHCYVKRLAGTRYKRYYPGGFHNVTEAPARLQEVIRVREQRWYEPAQHADLFHPKVSNDFRLRVFDVMRQSQRHLFQICTKYSTRMDDFISVVLPSEWLGELSHVMLGVSVEKKKYMNRVYKLSAWPHTTYVEFSPLLEMIRDIDLFGIDWVKIGCETGPGHRKCNLKWITTLIDEAKLFQIPVTVTAYYENEKLHGIPVINGRRWAEKPALYHEWRQV